VIADPSAQRLVCQCWRVTNHCKSGFPKVTIKFTVADSETVKARIEAHTLDIGVVFEDELVAKFARKPLFRQRLYLIAQSAREATTNLTGTSECRAQ